MYRIYAIDKYGLRVVIAEYDTAEARNKRLEMLRHRFPGEIFEI